MYCDVAQWRGCWSWAPRRGRPSGGQQRSTPWCSRGRCRPSTRAAASASMCWHMTAAAATAAAAAAPPWKLAMMAAPAGGHRSGAAVRPCYDHVMHASPAADAGLHMLCNRSPQWPRTMAAKGRMVGTSVGCGEERQCCDGQ